MFGTVRTRAPPLPGYTATGALPGLEVTLRIPGSPPFVSGYSAVEFWRRRSAVRRALMLRCNSRTEDGVLRAAIASRVTDPTSGRVGAAEVRHPANRP